MTAEQVIAHCEKTGMLNAAQKAAICAPINTTEPEETY